MSETLEGPVEEQKCASPRGPSFAACVHINTKQVNHPWMSGCLKIKRKSVLLTSLPTAAGNYFFSMLTVNQGQNLTVILAADCNLKLLSLKQISLSFPKSQENKKSKRILYLRPENFPVTGSKVLGRGVQPCLGQQQQPLTFAVVVPLAAEHAVLLLDVSPAQNDVLPALGIRLPHPVGNKQLREQITPLYSLPCTTQPWHCHEKGSAIELHNTAQTLPRERFSC